MQSDRDLLAQWAGEELFAAGRVGQDQSGTCRARGQFYLELMRCDPALPEIAPPEQPIIGRLLSEAFRSPRA
jgi:hypothetical protein